MASPIKDGSDWELKIMVEGGRVWDKDSGCYDWVRATFTEGIKVTRSLTMFIRSLLSGNIGIFISSIDKMPMCV